MPNIPIIEYQLGFGGINSIFFNISRLEIENRSWGLYQSGKFYPSFTSSNGWRVLVSPFGHINLSIDEKTIILGKNSTGSASMYPINASSHYDTISEIHYAMLEWSGKLTPGPFGKCRPINMLLPFRQKIYIEPFTISCCGIPIVRYDIEWNGNVVLVLALDITQIKNAPQIDDIRYLLKNARFTHGQNSLLPGINPHIIHRLLLQAARIKYGDVEHNIIKQHVIRGLFNYSFLSGYHI